MKLSIFKLYICALFTLLAFPPLCFGQDKDRALEAKIKSFENSGKFEVTFDKTKNLSNVWGGWLTLRPSKESKMRGSFEFGAAFPFAGKELKAAPEKITLFLKTDIDDAANLEKTELIFMIDGKMLNLGVGFAESGMRWIRKKSIVTLKTSYLLTPDECRYLAQGATVEFRLGEVGGLLTTEHKQLLKGIVALAELNK